MFRDPACDVRAHYVRTALYSSVQGRDTCPAPPARRAAAPAGRPPRPGLAPRTVGIDFTLNASVLQWKSVEVRRTVP